MKAPRDILLDEAKLRLKFATRQSIKANGGTQLAGENCGARQQRMSDCQLPNVPEFLRLDEAQDLDANAEGSPGWPHIARAMARNHGFELMPRPAVRPGGHDFHKALADCHREASEATAKVLDALSDGITADEIRKAGILAEIDEAIAAFVGLRGLCVAASEEGD